MARASLSTLRNTFAIGGVALLLAGLVACAPAAGEQPQGGAAPSGSTSTRQGADQALEKWQLDFAQCMRDQGIDMPDPGNGSQTMTKTDGMDEAAAACQKKLGEPPVGSGADDKASLNSRLETAKCLRERGYDAEDPQEGKATRIPDGLTDEDAAACGIQFSGGN